MPRASTQRPPAKFTRFPVVSLGAEYLVMGYLMRRNILTYKAPPNNEGYDLICIHPNPRHRPAKGQVAQVRVQVKSRYATDCDRGFPVKEVSFSAFDFLIVAFLNIGTFFGKNDGSTGSRGRKRDFCAARRAVDGRRECPGDASHKPGEYPGALD